MIERKECLIRSAGPAYYMPRFVSRDGTIDRMQANWQVDETDQNFTAKRQRREEGSPFDGSRMKYTGRPTVYPALFFVFPPFTPF